ncbi:CehA/McbA family metallohydrolase [bacterium]|nr:CehA/McbA family metallohydrolase [bacterium]
MPLPDAQPIIENENGRLEIRPGGPVAALSWGTWTFRWTTGFDVEPGGGIEIILVPRFPTNRWSLPQTHDPTAPGYVTARVAGAGDAIVSVDILRWPLLHKPHGATLHIIQVGVGNGTLKRGAAIEVTYGDQRGGSLGTQSQAIARVVAFPVFVSSGQAPKFLERFAGWDRHTDIATLRAHADFNPSLLVAGAAAASFQVVAPMEIEPGKPFAVRLAALDASCNAAGGYTGTVELRATDPAAVLPGPMTMAGSSGAASGVTLPTLGFHRLYAIDADHGVLGVSNPIRVRAGAQPVFWGEIHSHSELSDGNGTPDEEYTYARDVALLDFACLTDHDHHLEQHPDRWEVVQAKAKEHSRPGAFVALLGYEARTQPAAGPSRGDLNVYYRRATGTLLDKVMLPVDPAVAGGQDVIIVPHSPLYGGDTRMGTRWPELAKLSPSLMPLVEVFSTHGNSEYYDCPRHVLWQEHGQSVVDALRAGFRLGFIGSGDYHEVLSGNLLRIQDTPRGINHAHMQARGGLAAVRADDLSRDALFDALRARRTYATSGIRAYVEFTVNGQLMGTEFRLASPEEPRRLRFAVAAPERIVKLELVRNGDTVADLADGNWFVEGEWTDNDLLKEGTFYYVRATTEREDFAWSSPVWVDLAG